MTDLHLPAYESTGWHVAKFAETFCRHTKGRWARNGEHVVLEPWQREFVDEAFLIHPDGSRVYQTVVLGIPRKNGKSTLASVIALYLAVADGELGPEVILAAASGDQASIVFNQARDFIYASAELGEYLNAQQYIIKLRDAPGFIKRVSATGALQHGLNPSAVVGDELHAWTTPKHAELYGALTTGDAAREDPFALWITTAGFDPNTILGRLVFDAIAEGERKGIIERRPGCTIVRDREAGFLLVWYGLDAEKDDLDDPAVVKLANPASWVTPEYLKRKMLNPSVSRANFIRLHANAWTSAEEVWLPNWASLRAPGHREGDALIPAGAEVYLGVDVGLTNDTTAVAIAAALDERPTVAVEARVWATRQDVIAHEYLAGGRLDFEIVEDYLRLLASRYSIRAIVYDPRFFERSAQTLASEGITVAEIDQASATMSAAWQAFFQAYTEARIVHTGDPVLAAHVASAKARMTERGWKVSKLGSKRKIDALASSAMAHYYAARPESRSPYERRGLVRL